MTRLALLAALALAGCHEHDDDHPHGEETDPIEAGCAHLEFGPDISLDLAAANAPIVTVHTRYLLTLAGDAADYGGTLDLTATAADYYLLFDRAVELTLTDASGATVAPVHTMTDPAACAAAAIVHHYTLTAGDYTLDFGPTDSASLSMAVHRPGEDHAHAH